VVTPVGFDLATTTGSFHLELAYRAASHRLAIVGPSGAGKSMTLRALAGLAPGRVWFGADEVGGLPAERRLVGYVPQGDSLLPHLTVAENVSLGPLAQAGLAREWMEALELTDLAGRLPYQLSGGQRQRVALARALACGPRVVLLDEPFTGLDAPQRAALVRRLRLLQRGSGLSTVLVTHDISEAAVLADEVVVLTSGRMAQSGALPDVLDRPASRAIAGVLGLANVREGQAAAEASILAGAGAGGGGEGGIEVGCPPHGLARGTPVTWAAPPRLVQAWPGPRPGAHTAILVDVVEMGAYASATVELAPGLQLEADVAGRQWAPGARCWVTWPAEAVLVWPAAPAQA
jgi:molybdate transport system ATP-binding protein/molybdate transport system permease protein